MRNRERGEGKLGLFIFLAIVGAGIFYLVKWVPPRLNAYEFRDYMGQWNTDPDKVMRRATPDQVRDDLLRKAESLKLPISLADIRVSPQANKFNIEVSFEITTDLKVYKKLDRYEFVSSPSRPND